VHPGIYALGISRLIYIYIYMYIHTRTCVWGFARGSSLVGPQWCTAGSSLARASWLNKPSRRRRWNAAQAFFSFLLFSLPVRRVKPVFLMAMTVLDYAYPQQKKDQPKDTKCHEATSRRRATQARARASKLEPDGRRTLAAPQGRRKERRKRKDHDKRAPRGRCEAHAREA